MGSSGLLKLLPQTLEALAAKPVDVLLSTAGRLQLEHVPNNVTAVDYVDGDQACQRADVVITNGGSSTGYQALSHGKPVIGIPSNFDQYLASQAIDATGAGTSIPARQLTAARLSEALDQMLREPHHTKVAQELAKDMLAYPCAPRFRRFVDSVLTP